MDKHTTKALQLIAKEAQRVESRYGSEHDSGHVDGELAQAGAVYAMLSTRGITVRDNVRRSADAYQTSSHLADWPFDEEPRLGVDNSNRSRIKELVKAGNLITAELARRLRLDESID